MPKYKDKHGNEVEVKIGDYIKAIVSGKSGQVVSMLEFTPSATTITAIWEDGLTAPAWIEDVYKIGIEDLI